MSGHRSPNRKAKDGFYIKACPWDGRDKAGTESHPGPRNGGPSELEPGYEAVRLEEAT